MAAMLKAANEGKYNFVKEVSVYGERARKLKDIFLRHGFYIVYDKDLDEPVANGFYFTIGYPGMTGGELMRELMYYGVSAISLDTTGSNQEGLRVCLPQNMKARWSSAVASQAMLSTPEGVHTFPQLL